MIKITKAEYIKACKLHLYFSDDTHGKWDFSYLLNHNTSLTKSLKEEKYFKDFFLELGAICWKNGLEISAGSLHQKMQDAGLLEKTVSVA